ncbi:MAG: hypothetical protein ACRDWX_02995 [Acidimicrobiia bacterium]
MRPLLARLLGTTGGRTVLFVLILYMAFQATIYALAPSKVDEAVHQAVDAEGRVDVLVELNFPPERFHILVMQDYGRVTGTEGEAVEVRGISLEGVQELARKFWVRRIRPLEG